MKTKGRIGDTVAWEVTEEDYQEQLRAGATPDEAMKPGRHYGVRGGFLLRKDITREEWREISSGRKARITIMLDGDVLEYFRARAAAPGAAPYQTQINQALREVMTGQAAARETILPDIEELAERIAEKVAARLRAGGRKSRKAPGRKQKVARRAA
ncbi:MAG: BrnA antitoxin family protein [Blastocatellia bacterium]